MFLVITLLNPLPDLFIMDATFLPIKILIAIILRIQILRLFYGGF